MNENRILIINDVTAYGKVSSSAMMPIISAHGHHPYVLPTALVSNTMDYGNSVILNTSGFMKECISLWRNYGFSFPVIATGLINEESQIEIISNLIIEQQPSYLMVDPIMADDGMLYPGMNKRAPEYYKRLISSADLIIPNFTEATMLADQFTDRKELSSTEYDILVNSLRQIGADNIVITGCKEGSITFNLVYDATTDTMTRQEYEHIPISLIGTGDVFSATLISNIMSGHSLLDSVKIAGQFVRKVVDENRKNQDHYDIYIEHTIQEALNEIGQR